jgi:Skp family chaperone for outer membrane proteins
LSFFIVVSKATSSTSHAWKLLLLPKSITMLSSNSIVSFLAAACFLMHHSQHVASFSVSWNTKSNLPVGTALSVSFSAADEAPGFNHPNRIAEFRDLEPLVESAARLARKKEDTKIRRRFARYGDDLWALRKVIAELSKKLVKAINDDSRQKEQSLREKLRQMEEQDPEFAYKMELQKMRKAQNEERIEDAQEHSKRAMAARSQLPQYNLDGLWVGK